MMLSAKNDMLRVVQEQPDKSLLDNETLEDRQSVQELREMMLLFLSEQNGNISFERIR
jgi:Ca2+-binding EF-hand superfamily protein